MRKLVVTYFRYTHDLVEDHGTGTGVSKITGTGAGGTLRYTDTHHAHASTSMRMRHALAASLPQAARASHSSSALSSTRIVTSCQQTRTRQRRKPGYKSGCCAAASPEHVGWSEPRLLRLLAPTSDVATAGGGEQGAGGLAGPSCQQIAPATKI